MHYTNANLPATSSPLDMHHLCSAPGAGARVGAAVLKSTATGMKMHPLARYASEALVHSRLKDLPSTVHQLPASAVSPSGVKMDF
ncbi:hypothetical protein EVAR_100065_1 [Eumeta japonica]|uniref:Uncharacterized protein n=1 Tax=Eumeta variegata TaxID=151549 RepID=A0A4C2A4U9_EUMVA|nr:hypothetical protein EVAR_100065_1 [Eumeta japonica]